MNLNNLVQLQVVAAVELAENRVFTRRRKRPRILYTELSDREFKKNFRVNKETFDLLFEEIENYLVEPSRASAISKETKILSTLNLLGSGSYQNEIGNSFAIGLSTYSVSKALHEVIEALNQPRILNKYIKFPSTTEELNQIRKQYFTKFRIPGVVGCIDCTHLAIHPPNTHDPDYPEHVYVNRKGYHSINIQVVCDPDLKILHVNAKYPGSTNDKFIWSNSNISEFFETLHNRGKKGYHLLGDSGYPLRSWLLIPFGNPEEESPEETFNKCHKRCRATIERCNGVLKGRFRCLCKERTLHYSPQFASQIINACCVLHNMCVINNVEFDENEVYVEEVDDHNVVQDQAVANRNVNRVNPLLGEGRRKRDNIVHNDFIH